MKRESIGATSKRSNTGPNINARRRQLLRRNAKLASAIRPAVEALELRQMLSADPVAVLNGPFNVIEGESILLDGSASTDDGEIASYSWDFNYVEANGFSADDHGNPVWFQGDDGPATRTIALRVADDEGNLNTTTAQVTIENANPELSISGNTEGGSEGTVQSYHANASDPGNDSLTYSWSVTLNDAPYTLENGLDTTSADFQFIPRDNGTFKITCALSDGEGGTASASLDNVVVSNATPSVYISTANSAFIPNQGTDNVTQSGGTFPAAFRIYAGSMGSGQAIIGVMKWALPQGLTAEDVNGATLTLHRGGHAERQVDLYAFDSASASVSGADYAAAASAETLLASDILASDSGTVTVTGEGITQAIKDALNNGRDYLTLAVRHADNSDQPGVSLGWFGAPGNTEQPELRPRLTITTTPILEGSIVPFNSSFSDLGDDDTHTFAWTVTRGETPYDVSSLTTNESTFDFIPRDKGQYTITLTVTDDDEAASSDSFDLTVVNASPGGTITGEPLDPIAEGTEVELGAHPIDSDVEDVNFTYEWWVTRAGDEGTYALPEGTDVSSDLFKFTPRNDGTYTAHCRIMDGDGGSVVKHSADITVTNANPTVSISGVPAPQGTTTVSATLPENAAASVESDGDVLPSDILHVGERGDASTMVIAVMKWQFPEGLTADDVQDATFSFHSIQGPSGQVDLYAFDSASSDVVAGDYTTMMGQSVTPIASAVLGNGEEQDCQIHNAALVQAVKDAINNGRDHLSLGFVTLDGLREISQDDVGVIPSATMVFESQRPSLTLTVPAGPTVYEGSTTTLTADGHDAGAEDELSYAWTVKRNDVDVDLTGQTADQATFDFIPVDEGDYAVTVTVTDSNNGSTSSTVNITAINANPAGVVEGLSGNDLYEGEPINLSVDAGDPGIADELSYSWTVTKGGEPFELPEGTNTTGTDFSFTPADEGDYDLMVTITDGDGGSATIHSPVTILNAAPQGEITGQPEEPKEGTAITLTADVTDAGVNDELTYSWTVTKDEQEFYLSEEIDVSSRDFTFTPTDNGTYVATCVVSDGATTAEFNSGEMIVANVDPTATIENQPSGPVHEGDEVNISVQPHDVGEEDDRPWDFEYAWTVTQGEESYTLPEDTYTEGRSLNFVPRNNGTYVATVRVTDKDGGYVEVSSDPIVVNNANPIVTITGDPTDLATHAIILPSSGSDSVLDNGTLMNSKPAFLVGEWSNHLYTGIMKWTLPEGLTVDNLEGASIALQPYMSTPRQVNLYAFDSNSSTVVGADYAAAASATNLIASDLFLNNTNAVTINNEPLIQAIKDAITAGRSYVSFAMRQTDTTVHHDNIRALIYGPEYGGGDDGKPTLTIHTTIQPTYTGDTITLTSHMTDPGSEDTQTYAWTVLKDGEEYNPGEVATDGETFNFTAWDIGTYSVTVTVTDNDEGVGSATTANIEVLNGIPEGEITGIPENAVEGTPITLTADASDPNGDTLTYSWHVTRGLEAFVLPEETDTTSREFTFTPTDDGSYVVSCTVSDGTANVNLETDPITVANADPVVSINVPEMNFLEGTEIPLTLNASDPGSEDELSYSWSVTKGEAEFVLPEGAETTAATFAFTPDDNGEYVVTCVVTDGDGGSKTAQTSAITVHNVDPFVESVSGLPTFPDTVPEGTPVTLTANLIEPGLNEEVEFAWTVYDVNTNEPVTLPEGTDVNSQDFTFTPSDNGYYRFTVVVTDKDGGTNGGYNTPGMFVTNANPNGEISGTPETEVNEGTPIELSVTATDPGLADANLTYVWRVMRGEGEPFALPEGTVTDGTDFTFTPTDNGSYVVTVVIADKDNGETAVSTAPITVVNIKPEVTLTGGPEGNGVEGTPMSFGVDASDAGAEDALTYAWTVKKDDEDYFPGEGVATDEATFTFTPDNNGEYVVTCVVTDNNEASTTVSTEPITVENADPIVTITGTPETSIVEGTEVDLAADASDAGVNDTLSYSWSVKKDDNAYTLNHVIATDGQSFSFIPEDDGDYVVSVTVTDEEGGSVTETTSFTVTNADPTGEITGAPETSIVEGTTVNLSVTPADAGARDTFTYSWSLEATDSGWTLPQDLNLETQSLSFAPGDNGSYVAKVTITDKDGGQTVVSTDPFTVTNANPTAEISGAPESSIAESRAVHLSVDASDAGSMDTLTYAWSVKKGDVTYTLPNGTVTDEADFTFTPRDNGSYTATVVVTDKDNGSVTVSTEAIIVTNVNPTATLTGEPTSAIDQGTQLSLNVSASDAGADDTLTYAWTVKRDNANYTLPNSIVTTGSTFTFTPMQGGSYIATCVISDDDSGSITKHSNAFTVTNVAPSATVSIGSIAVRGRTTVVNAIINDPGESDTETVTWDWGDGSAVETFSSANAQHVNREHIYAHAGNFTVSVTAKDNSNATGTTATTLVTVKQAAMQVDPMDPEKTALIVGGTPEDDIIKFSLTGAGSIKVTINGIKYGTYAPTGHIYAYGESGTNQLLVEKQITVPAVLYGGSGRDLLSGGSGDDVIIGRKGNDSIFGNGGRDVLIGGVGSDSLAGGTEDDILIGGTTVSMESFNSLALIAKEWSRTDANTLSRMKHLRGSLEGGLNEDVKLTSGWVFEEAGYDQLTGNAGRDWFFVSQSTGGDKINDLSLTEDAITHVTQSVT